MVLDIHAGFTQGRVNRSQGQPEVDTNHWLGVPILIHVHSLLHAMPLGNPSFIIAFTGDAMLSFHISCAILGFRSAPFVREAIAAGGPRSAPLYPARAYDIS